MAISPVVSSFVGSDTSCVTDLSRIDLQITDPGILVGQRIARRLQTPRGALALIGGNPNFGLDVRQYVLAKQSPAQRQRIEGDVLAEVLKDQQVQSAVVRCTSAGDYTSISVAFVIAEGPYLMTMNVDDLTTQLVFSFSAGQ